MFVSLKFQRREVASCSLLDSRKSMTGWCLYIFFLCSSFLWPSCCTCDLVSCTCILYFLHFYTLDPQAHNLLRLMSWMEAHGCYNSTNMTAASVQTSKQKFYLTVHARYVLFQSSSADQRRRQTQYLHDNYLRELRGYHSCFIIEG